MPLSLNRIINVEDFVEPVVRGTIRDVFAHEVERHPDFPSGREHRKHWEVAMAVLALRETGALRPDAEVLGIGAGNEPTSFWLTNHVRRVWATDLYADPGVWAPNASSTMLTDPGRHWPGPWNPRRLVIQHVNAMNLTYEDETFDAIFSSGSFEHFGGLDQARRAMAEAYRVLKPGGVMSLSTEILLEGDPLAMAEQTIMFTREMIADDLIGDRDWEPVTPPDYNVSRATWETAMPIEQMLADHARHQEGNSGELHLHELDLSRYPLAVLRAGSNLFTSVHLALRKPLREADIQARRPDGPIRISGPRDDVAGLAQYLHDPVVVVDAGCRWGFDEHWTALHPHVRMIGFDPDDEECRRLEERYSGHLDVTLVPIALSSSSERRNLRRFKFSAANSFHPHDERSMRHMAVPREGDVLDELVEVDVETLDRWCSEHDVVHVDAMKLDVQGHELEILRGAIEQLAGVRAVEAEVCLNPITEGTPLFGDVDAFLRERGFYLWRLRDLVHYPVKEGIDAAGSIEVINHFGYDQAHWAAPPGFLSWCNAHWVKFELLDAEARLPWEVRLRDAVLMNALRFHDLAVIALRRALEASPPAAVAEQVRFALEAATVAPRPADAPASEQPEEPESPLVGMPELSASAPRRRWRRVRRLAGKPYRPLVWRLERNHMHAQWRADAHDQRLDELRDRIRDLEASIGTLDDRLATSPPPSSSTLEDEVRDALSQLRQVHEVTNEAVVEWTALMSRAVGADGERRDNGASG